MRKHRRRRAIKRSYIHARIYTHIRSIGSNIPGGKIEVSSSLRVINNRYIIGGGWAVEARGKDGRTAAGVEKGRRRGCERAAAHLRPAERGWRKRRRGPGGGEEGNSRREGVEGVPIYTSILNLLR